LFNPAIPTGTVLRVCAKSKEENDKNSEEQSRRDFAAISYSLFKFLSFTEIASSVEMFSAYWLILLQYTKYQQLN